MIGAANASVLPVPVSAHATTSWPSSASGITAPCTGRVPSKPSDVKARLEPRIEAHRVERNRRRVDVDHFPRQIRRRRRRPRRKRFAMARGGRLGRHHRAGAGLAGAMERNVEFKWLSSPR